MQHRAAPIPGGQGRVGQLSAAGIVRVHRGVAAIASIQVRPAARRQALAIAEELIDAIRKIRAVQRRRIQAAAFGTPGTDWARAGEERLIGAGRVRVGAEGNRALRRPRF